MPAASGLTVARNAAQQGEHDGQLYLARQVEVQPVFNREFIAELSDVASANLLSLENLVGSEGGNARRGAEALADGTGIEGYGGSGAKWTMDIELADSSEALEDLEQALVVAVKAGDRSAVDELLKALLSPANARGSTEARSPVSRILWRAVLEDPPTSPLPAPIVPNGAPTTNGQVPAATEGAIPTALLDFMYVDDINGRTTLHEVRISPSLPTDRS